MGVVKSGDWSKARALLRSSSTRLRGAVDRAVAREAHALRAEIVDGLTKQAPGGQPLKPLAAMTLATRQMQRFGGTKALIRRGDLRNAVAVVKRGDDVFIGVPRTARSSDGEGLVDTARVHEFGTQPTVIPMTPAMRRFLFAVMRERGIVPRGGGGRGVIVMQIPARPFLRPAFQKQSAGAARRFLANVARDIGLPGRA